MTEVRELIDAELDGVCGGFFDTTNLNELTNKIIANVQTINQKRANYQPDWCGRRRQQRLRCRWCR